MKPPLACHNQCAEESHRRFTIPRDNILENCVYFRNRASTIILSVANYRQTVLTAFQQIEDNLAALRILSEELQQLDVAINAADNSLQLATSRYKAGLDPYLNVITAQAALLGNQQSAVALRMQQMTASVQLIEALGGGWDSSKLPSAQDVSAKSAPAAKQNR
jgi:hypothetical protein